jgi:hypothetical protein
VVSEPLNAHCLGEPGAAAHARADRCGAAGSQEAAMAAQAVHVHVPLPWDTMRLCDGRTQTALGPRGRSWHARRGQLTAKQKRRFNPVASASRSRQWREQLAGRERAPGVLGTQEYGTAIGPAHSSAPRVRPPSGQTNATPKRYRMTFEVPNRKRLRKHFKRIRIAPEPRPDPIGSDTLGPQAVRRRMHVYVGNGSSD